MKRAAALVFVIACGGASDAGGSAKTAHDGTNGKTDDSIADVASREGLPSLGGSSQSGTNASGSLHLELVDKDNPIHMDGTVKEWSLVSARVNAKGSADSIGFKCALGYDSQYVYFAGEVTGVTLRHLRRF